VAAQRAHRGALGERAGARAGANERRPLQDGRQPLRGRDIKGLGGEEAVQTFAISGGWRIVGNCG
jgi:hypothetical protein